MEAYSRKVVVDHNRKWNSKEPPHGDDSLANQRKPPAIDSSNLAMPGESLVSGSLSLASGNFPPTSQDFQTVMGYGGGLPGSPPASLLNAQSSENSALLQRLLASSQYPATGMLMSQHLQHPFAGGGILDILQQQRRQQELQLLLQLQQMQQQPGLATFSSSAGLSPYSGDRMLPSAHLLNASQQNPYLSQSALEQLYLRGNQSTISSSGLGGGIDPRSVAGALPVSSDTSSIIEQLRRTQQAVPQFLRQEEKSPQSPPGENVSQKRDRSEQGDSDGRQRREN